MLSCREVTKLVSESMDRKLSFWQRANVWMHLAMCRLCWGFRKNLRDLRKVAHKHAEDVEGESSSFAATLPDETRDRMKRMLESQRS